MKKDYNKYLFSIYYFSFGGEFMKTEEFKQHAHFRNGVEALPSLLRRKYHVDKIPTRGKKQTRFHFGFKIAALNLKKLLDYENSLVHYAAKKEIA